MQVASRQRLITDPGKVVCAFDCDGTLMHHKTHTPRYEIIMLFEAMRRIGCHMVVWSHSGKRHAELVRNRLGLKAEAMEKYTFTPDIAVDDEECGLGKVNICVNAGSSEEGA